MFFYTLRSHHHKTINLQDQTCPVCKNRGVLKMHLMQQYASVIFPIMPGKKYAVLDCDYCKKTIPNKLWSKELDAIYKQEKKVLKTPKKFLLGLLVFLMLGISPFVYIKYKIDHPTVLNQVNKWAIENCKVGDVLFVEFRDEVTEKSDFSLAKVIKMDANKTILTTYSDKFDYKDQYVMRLSDVDNSKFGTIIEVKTPKLKTYGHLLYVNPTSEKLKYFVMGYILSNIKE
ncbi:hypothetical protein [Flavobacterium muglaense]|uniref:Zinc-ribbon 15 domain-containing protein n=1 Tax=Flavobacterium muglaense TaxID=2764716 RepID=A0A923SFP0_9FLAO|nr:hypothetical protein [Flavobacterium muglaense]MBC5838276.1 hypothetical protein [Flavobacterium muglaense]MBC5844811.1 hypothetical protein [Flavobacterium muglaense]